MNKKIILITFLSLILTGCYDYKELNTIAIVSATEVNKIDNTYYVTAQVITPQAPEKTATVQAPFIIYTGSGKTVQEAYRTIVNTSSRYLYSNHLQLLIINEKIAKEDITEIVDYFVRNPNIRTEFYVTIGKSDNILANITPIDQISSASIKNSINNNIKFLGTSSKTTFNDFINMLINPNLEIILPSIEIINEQDQNEGEKLENTEETIIKSKYRLDNLAIFKDNKLLSYLTEEESKSYNIVKNNINNTLLTYECHKDKYITIEIIESKSNFTINYNQVNINIDLEGNINESHCYITPNNKNDIQKLTKELENYLNKSISNNLNQIKEKYNSDVFGFLESIYKHNYSYYQKIKSSWSKDTFKNMKITVNTNLTITGKGNTLEEINEKNN